MKFYPHRREDMITKLVPVEYNPQSTCPLWLEFLDRVMAGNWPLIDFLARAVGYTLTGLTTEQVLFFCYGLGANGKTTFIRTIQGMLGDYAVQATPDLLLARRDGTAGHELARLRGARMVVTSELDDGRRMAESLVKQLTGGDIVVGRHLYSEAFEFKPTFKLWMVANHRPVIRGTDEAIWRRILLIPFEVTIPPAEQDKALPEKLKRESPGIMNWALQGCLEWQRDGLNPPPEVFAAVKDYREDMDVLGAFLADCADTTSAFGEVSAKQLRTAYENWCTENGERPLSQKALAPHLAERGFERFRRNDGWWWRGLKLQ